ncbi:hypothetical protein BCR35DRAFT_333041 [Leucosporidium creatinivorum]|uniref:GATA-type domain-containing protein n=1 Tax=Leucosporidium creatinivorum TaxID=106004 RepID=A0A1Y2EVN3_9BASI|nr:hypothetical protein BCR35DRAFT_333041 [Leucosporidium creatinivorum]
MDRRSSYGRAPPSPSRPTSPRPVGGSVMSGRGSAYSPQSQSLPSVGVSGGRRVSGGAISPSESASTSFPLYYNTPASPSRQGNPYQDAPTFASRAQQSPQSYNQPQSPPPRRSSLGGGGKPYERQQRQDPLAHLSQGRVHQQHQGFQQSQLHHLQRPISPLDLDEDLEEDDRRKRGRTPPDMCAVCAETSTPEWRKGPAGARMLCNGCGLMSAKRAKERAQNGFGNPTTIASIIRELQGIGEERFKVTAGEYQLPPNTPARILATQARTAEQESKQKSSKPRERKFRTGAPEREAAESLVGMARRASISQQSPPAAPSSSFGGRRGSFNSAQRPTIYSLPRGRRANSFTPAPSQPGASLLASAMASTGPSPSYSFGGAPSMGRDVPSLPSTNTGRSPTRRAPSPSRPRTPVAFASSSTSPLTSSNRMNISYITDPTPVSPSVTWGVSDLRTRRTPSPGAGARQRRLSLSEMEMAFEKRRSQQYS